MCENFVKKHFFRDQGALAEDYFLDTQEGKIIHSDQM